MTIKYYVNKISLPYTETIGVGEYADEVTINTREELLEFLRSYKAIMVFSNSHDLLAMANLFNMRIRVFSYGGPKDRWDEICPDGGWC